MEHKYIYGFDVIMEALPINRERIQDRVRRLSYEVNNFYYNDRELVVIIGILDGAFMFLSDLCKEFFFPNILDFIGLESYKGDNRTDNLSVTKSLKYSVSGRRVLIVDDIFDSGYTLGFAIEHIKSMNPESINTCVLLSKQKSKYRPDFVGFTIPNVFVVGYGLDYDGKYRTQKFISEYKK